MRNSIYTLLLPVLLMTAAVSCKKEAALTPTGINVGYTLPQGNNGFDTAILNFYGKYNTYILYVFTGKDTYWTPTGWQNADSANNKLGYLVQPANTAYVGNQLSLLNWSWFGYYTDKFLKTFLPSRIMLCSEIDSAYPVYVFTPTFHTVVQTKQVTAWYNYDNICVGKGSSAINSMTAADSLAFMAKVNLIFIQSIVGRNLSTPTSDFASATNYATTVNSQALAYANGILYTYYNGPTAIRDWGMYMQAMVSFSYTKLNKSTSASDATFNGILNATKDVNGVIRKRYNIIRNYFINTYNVDLQAIGNVANP